MRRTCAALLAVSLLLPACGGGGDDVADGSTSPDGSQADASQADGTTPTTDAGVGPDAAPFSVQLIATEPPSPAPDPTPDVIGAAGAGCVTAEVYRDSSELLGSGPITGGAFTINVMVPVNGTTTLTGRCRAMDGTASPFSDPLVYTHDDIPPPAPFIVGTSPSSPAPELRPTVIGTVGSPDCLIVVIRDATGTVFGEDLAGAGTFSVALTADLPAETTSTLVARCEDLAGNQSAQSNGFDYTHSSTAPVAPVITGSVPASPGTSFTPTLSGTAPLTACVTVEVWEFGVGMLASTAPTAGAWSVAVTVDANATTDLRARCLDSGGMASGFSGPFLYVHDSIAPATPTIDSVVPASPATDPTPAVGGTAPTDCATVTIRDAGGTSLGSGPAAGGTFSVTAAVPTNTTSLLRARCADAAGNQSGDSNVVNYTHDDIAPPTPLVTGTTPTSPSSSLMPEVNGTVSGGDCTLVEVWDTTTLLGSEAPAGGAFGVTVTVPAETTTMLRARCVDGAGNSSPYSASIAYTHSAALPGPPTLLATTPPSPSNQTAIMVSGTAPTMLCAAVEIWNDMSTMMGEGAPSGGTFSVAVVVPTNTTTQLRGRCRASGGTLSDFSAALPYVHDSVAPPAPTIGGTTPASPSNDLTPDVYGTIAGPDCAVVEIYNNQTFVKISEGPSGPGLTFTVNTTVNMNGLTALSAKCRDAAGNLSPFSTEVDYTHDGVAPTTPTLTGTTPASPNSDTTPIVNGLRGAANGDCTYIQIWNDMTSMIVEGPQIGPAISIEVTVTANATTALRARCRDNAGNLSGFSGSITYVNDSMGPTAPTLAGTMPPPPSPDSTPDAYGTASDPTCVAVEVHVNGAYQSEVAPAAMSWTAGTFVTTNNTSTIKARCRDGAGNFSPFTPDFSYLHDSVAPTPAPTIAGTNPVSPGTSTTPEVYGVGAPVDCAFIDVWRETPLPAALLDSAPRQADGSWAVFVPVATNVTTVLKARCRDVAGNLSGFGPTIDYMHDDMAPTAPTITSPVSGVTSNVGTFNVSGNSPGGCGTVEVWSSTVKLSEGPAAATTFSVSTTVPANVTTLLRARCRDGAGNFSPYSANVSYTHDDIVPGAPTIDSTDPVPPSNDSTITVYGSSPLSDCPFVEVRNALGVNYGDATPSGGAWSKAITVTTNTTTNLRARCRDNAGNLSPFSADFPYLHDSAAPPPPLITSIAGPGSFPTINGTQNSQCVELEVRRDGFAGPPTMGPVVYVTGAVSGTTYSLPFTTAAYAPGPVDYVAYCRDAAGNWSGPSVGHPYAP